ncbi:MAG TPA: hypothetical protein VNO23_10105, partial [Candidatus Binatia bacterium]|nr:hypothetical protein [Candidatus Binatia bacterium]
MSGSDELFTRDEALGGLPARRAATLLFLIPSSMKAGDIARVLRQGYDVGVLRDGLHELIDALGL